MFITLENTGRIVGCEMGEEQQGFRRGMKYGGWDVHCETTGGEETGGTGEYGHVEVDGCPRGGGEDGRRHI